MLFHYFDRFFAFPAERGDPVPPVLFFKYKRRLLGSLCLAAVQALLKYFQVVTGTELVPGVVASIQTFGNRINLHPHAHCLVSERGEDKEGQVNYRYGKEGEEECPRVARRGWAEIRRKV